MLFTRREIPEEVQDLAWEFYRLYFSGRSGFRRFSSSERAFWEGLLEKAWKLTEVKELKKRIGELEEDPERFALLLSAILESGGIAKVLLRIHSIFSNSTLG